jgi:hypothetical protein
MWVHEVARLFRQYCDEPDESFMAPADVAIYLGLGYGEFREKVMTVDPSIYSTSVRVATLAATDHRIIDLSAVPDLFAPGETISITGPNATAPRLHRVISLCGLDSKGEEETSEWRPLSRVGRVTQGERGYVLSRSILGMDMIILSEAHRNPLLLTYVPESIVDWTKQEPSQEDDGDEWIDQLGPFHDLIALYAYAQYAIRDWADNAPRQAQLQRREQQLVDHMSRRAGAAPVFVEDLPYPFKGR